jgi:large subunit ribosomal protein L3
MADKPDKNLKRALTPPKQHKDVTLSADGVTEVRVLAQTQPHLIGLKKTPEIIEIAIGGAVVDQLSYAQGILGKEIKASEVFVDGQQVDAHGVTKGKGKQGPVKRHGVMIRSHKAQKTKRGPATLGPWDGNRSYRVAHAGQMGFGRRTEINKWVLRVEAKPEELNCKGGFVHYGILKSSCMLIKGSLMGPSKRLITLTQPVRPNTYLPKQAPAIVHISTQSKQ